jgi:hypothetical protein
MAAYRARVTGKRSPSEPDIKSVEKKTARRLIAGEPFSKKYDGKVQARPWNRRARLHEQGPGGPYSTQLQGVR